MGNRTSSSALQPAAPPPLLSAAVSGDSNTFASLWNSRSAEERLDVKDRQDNNVLHALFSCRQEGKVADEILRLIHETTDQAALVPLYKARNQLGCTPLWILIAYGNVNLLQQVTRYAISDDASLLRQALPALVAQSNHQGDTPFLATCSQGNLAMVQYLMTSCSSNTNNDSAEQEDTTPWLLQQDMETVLTQGNQKGTTPLQIVIANGHLSLLQYMLTTDCKLPKEQVWQVNAAGLSLFHICSERNFSSGLQALLDYVVADTKTDENGGTVSLDKVLSLKDRNGANPLHVACFCGNVDVVKVWVDVISQTIKESSATVALLDHTDGQGRTAYWIACVQGHEESIGQTILAPTGVQTAAPEQMVREIAQARERREQRKAAAKQPMIDGNALLGR